MPLIVIAIDTALDRLNYSDRVQFDLVPSRDLTVISDPSAQSWTVSGARPLFELRGKTDGAPQPGWYLVTTDLSSTHDQDMGLPPHPPVALRFLPESGSLPLARRPVPVVAGRRTRVVHLPVGTERITLEVSPWLQTVSGTTVTLRPLPAAVAAATMSADVAASSVRGSTDPKALTRRLTGARNTKGNRAMLQEIAVAYEHLQHGRSFDGVDYPSWRVRHATMFVEDAERLAARCAELPDGGPLISIVVPVYNPEIPWLEAAVESVLAQSYSKWQLLLVNDASTDPLVSERLDKFEASDERIVVHHRATNGHIAAATNDGLALATGEFVAFMDHDDALAPFALGAIALESEGADVLYTDEDKIDQQGGHYDPHFKPSWNPELLLGQNYLSHLTVIRRSLIEQVGGLRTGFDGSQDHDLVLRATKATSSDRIVHIPLVAYHWRAIAGSTALAPGEKSYTEDASIRALQDRLGKDWTVELADAPTAYRCIPPLLKMPLVSIIIPTRDRLELVTQCIDSLAATTYPSFEILIVDNDSAEPETLAWFKSFDNGNDRRVISAPGPFNYSRINNLGVAEAAGELVLLLNNDTEVIDPNWLTTMVRWILQPNVGAVGAKLLYPNDTIQHAGVVLGLGGFAGHGHLHEPAESSGYFNRLFLTHEVGAATAACLLTRRDTWDSLGGLDEELAVAFNDIDYCLRVRNETGQRILWTPDALLYHHESVSRGAEDDPVKVARFNKEVDLALDRWADVLANDPAYSPNLTLEANSFTIARQPRITSPWASLEDDEVGSRRRTE